KRCDGAPVRPGAGTTRQMSWAPQPAKQSGTWFADTIRASGQTPTASTGRTEDCTRPTSQHQITLATREPSTEVHCGRARDRTGPVPAVDLASYADRTGPFAAAYPKRASLCGSPQRTRPSARLRAHAGSGTARSFLRALRPPQIEPHRCR